MEITIIHGTWAKEAEWADEKSILYGSLKNKFPDANIEPFEWSGANRVSKREEAKQDLIKYLKEKDGEHLLIAHSHGGNLAIEILSDQSLKIKGIVTMGSPFFFVIERDVKWLIDIISTSLGGIMIALSALVFLPYRQHFLLSFTFIPIGFFFIKYSKNIAMFFSKNSHPIKQEKKNEAPILCLISGEDEAIGWLQFFDNISNLPSLLLGKWTFKIFYCLMYLSSIFFYFDESSEIMKTFGLNPSIHNFLIMSLLFVIAFYFFLITFSFIMSSILRGLCHGGNIASKTNFTTRVTITLIPIGFKNVEFRVISLPIKYKAFLAHSALQEDQGTIDLITDWIQSKTMT